jgi:hypothetical protein
MAALLATPAIAAPGQGCKFTQKTVKYEVKADGSQTFSGQSNTAEFPGGQEAVFAFALTFEDVKATVQHLCLGGGVEQWNLFIPGLRPNGDLRPTPRAEGAGANYQVDDTRVNTPPQGQNQHPDFRQPCGWELTESTSLLQSGLTTQATLKERRGDPQKGTLDADAGLAVGTGGTNINAYAQMIHDTHEASCPGRLLGLDLPLPEVRSGGLKVPDPRPQAPRAEVDAINTSSSEVLREVLKHLAKGRNAVMGAELEDFFSDFGGWGSSSADYRVRLRFNRTG